MSSKIPSPRRPDLPTDDHSQPVGHPLGSGISGGGPNKNPLNAIIGIIAAIVVVGVLIPVLSSVFVLTDGVSPGTLLAILAVVFVLGVIVKNVVIVPQGSAYVIEVLGKYSATWEAGLHIKIPFLSRIANKVSLKEQVYDFVPQSVITKDNVTMKIDTVVYLKYFDPKLLTYGVEHPIAAVENLTATTLRNIIGDMELDATLTSRDAINGQLTATMDEATDPWGIKISRVELKNIMPPRDIQESMEKQMRAERERREAILQAEGTKQAAILEAEGVKQATILRAEAEKQETILKAQADKEAAVTRAEGEAQAMKALKDAEAYGIEAIKKAGADSSVIQMRSLATLEEMAKGQATTLVIPGDLAGIAGGLAALKTVAEKAGAEGAAK